MNDDLDTDLPDEELPEGADDLGEGGGDETLPENDDEQQAAPEASDPEPGNTPAEPQRGRANTRIRAQQAELQATRAREQDLRSQLDAVERERQAAQTAAQAAQHQQYLAGLDPDERAGAVLEQRFQTMQQQLQRQQWEIQEQNDRSTFRAQQDTNPLVAKYADRVEQQLLAMRKAGNTAPRESVFYYLVGQDMAKKTPAAVAKARATAAAKSRAAQGTPPRSRADAGNGGRASDGDSLEALEDRLRGVIL